MERLALGRARPPGAQNAGVGVERDPIKIKPAHAKRRQAVVVLQVAERSLYGGLPK
ncbi:MAG TPA: hypothetical protein VFN93_01440 [Gaiellaceae bacterium]|nr:hypothetical protein [Gaiellaceae bacterium]